MGPNLLNERAILSANIISIAFTLLFVTLLAGVMYSGWPMYSDSSVQHSVLINTSDVQLNYSELNVYAEKMGATNISEKNGLLENMMKESLSIGVPVFCGAWTDGIETESGESECLLMLYKSSTADPVGRDHYYFCMWTVAEPDTSHTIRNLWSRVQLTDDESRLIIYTPGSTIVKPERTPFFGNVTEPALQNFNIRFSADMNGYEDPFMYRNTISPKTGECRVGHGGKYAVEWNGCSEKSQDMTGVMHVDVPAGQSVCAEWTNSLHIS